MLQLWIVFYFMLLLLRQLSFYVLLNLYVCANKGHCLWFMCVHYIIMTCFSTNVFVCVCVRWSCRWLNLSFPLYASTKPAVHRNIVKLIKISWRSEILTFNGQLCLLSSLEREIFFNIIFLMREKCHLKVMERDDGFKKGIMWLKK